MRTACSRLLLLFKSRDVKPGNFLFTRKLNKGYLIDFNLALDLNKKYGNAGPVYNPIQIHLGVIPRRTKSWGGYGALISGFEFHAVQNTKVGCFLSITKIQHSEGAACMEGDGYDALVSLTCGTHPFACHHGLIERLSQAFFIGSQRNIGYCDGACDTPHGLRISILGMQWPVCRPIPRVLRHKTKRVFPNFHLALCKPTENPRRRRSPLVSSRLQSTIMEDFEGIGLIYSVYRREKNLMEEFRKLPYSQQYIILRRGRCIHEMDISLRTAAQLCLLQM